MEIKGILFDKDGTLIEFGSMWISISKNVIGDVLEKYNIDGGESLMEELLLKKDVSGIKYVGVLSGVGAQEDLKINAHNIIPSVGHIGEVL